VKPVTAIATRAPDTPARGRSPTPGVAAEMSAVELESLVRMDGTAGSPSDEQHSSRNGSPGRDLGSEQAELVRSRIITAARECFARYGVTKTSMVDVARVAGISRARLYQLVTGRDEVLEAVVVLRVEEIVVELQPTLLGGADWTFDNAITETVVGAAQLALNDPELQNLAATATSTRLYDVIAGSFPGVREPVHRFFLPAFDRGLAAGDLRTDISVEEMIDWVRSTIVLLMLHGAIDDDQARRTAREFLLPALTCRCRDQ
jgi:AcrR family transcriptional regulator